MGKPAGKVAALLAAVTLSICGWHANGWVSPASAAVSAAAVTHPAVPRPGDGKGTGYCKGYAGGVTSAYSFDDVYACRGTTTGATTFDNPGKGVYAWQCTELSARFLWAVHGIWAGPGSGVLDGADLVSVVHSHDQKIAVGTPGPGSVPAAGDVISLGPGGAVDKDNGHTAVVIASNPRTGQFTVMSQNYPDGTAAEQTAQIDLTGGHDGDVNYDKRGWTKASWLKLAMPPVTNPGQLNNLQSVQALSGSDAWAAGFYCQSCTQFNVSDRTLILRWNGREWTRFTTPDPGGDNDLYGIAADSGTDAWAVGDYCTPDCDTSGQLPLILHWNGTAWSQSPTPGTIANGFLNSVAATSPANAWAAGTSGDGKTLILHWNGKKWSQVPSPRPAPYSDLQSVTATSPSSAWAAGLSGTNENSLILHWNGKAWSAAKVPNVFPLWGIAATSATRAWAVGDLPEFLRWNGTTWSKVAVPYLGGAMGFSGVSSDSAADAWAVGDYCASGCDGNSPNYRDVIIHWNGKTWTRAPQR